VPTELLRAQFANVTKPAAALALSPKRFATSFQLNLHYDAAILPQNDRIGTEVSAISTQILSCPQIKRAIVKRTDDRRSTYEAVSQWSPSMRAIGLGREHLARVGVVDRDVAISLADRPRTGHSGHQCQTCLHGLPSQSAQPRTNAKISACGALRLIQSGAKGSS
jgi:hypothetical protein